MHTLYYMQRSLAKRDTSCQPASSRFLRYFLRSRDICFYMFLLLAVFKQQPTCQAHSIAKPAISRFVISRFTRFHGITCILHSGYFAAQCLQTSHKHPFPIRPEVNAANREPFTNSNCSGFSRALRPNPTKSNPTNPTTAQQTL